jgi:hypothetical protein
MSESISCTLAENAIDYLLLAGEQAKDGSARLVKHSMAGLMDGLELLLKARLEAADWRQVFRNPSEADEAKYKAGDFFSVSYHDLLSRLKSTCSFEIGPHDGPILDRLRMLRNRIRHFAVDTDHATAISLIVKAYSFAVKFTGDELEDAVAASLTPHLQSLRLMLAEFEEFTRHRWTEIQPDIDGQRWTVFVDCPACLQRSVHADGDGEAAVCLFCRRRADSEQVAQEIVEQHTPWMSPKDRLCDEPDVEECPECPAMACLAVGRLLGLDVGYVCLACGESGDYARCSECPGLYSGESTTNRCEECDDKLMARND